MTMNTLLIRRQTVILLLLGLASTIPNTFAGYIGGTPPKCPDCPCKLTCTFPSPSPCPTAAAGPGAEISLTEGNLREPLPELAIKVARTLDLTLTYNSYDADGSHAQIDTVLGYGWTHSYNRFLFRQGENIFYMEPTGTEKFQLGPGGTYTAATGYFNKLVKNPDGSFTLTTKDQTVYQFAIVPGTPFGFGGPLYRLLSITDRNNNTTTLTYAGGNLVRITDTYGRFLTLTSRPDGHLTKVTDQNMHTTTFDYDSSGRHLARITDPNGQTMSYTYNTLNQMLSRTDRDGRRFTHQYENNLPVGMKDSASNSLFSLTNSSNWATSFQALVTTQTRVYVPSTTQKTDGRGQIWSYKYDANGYVTDEIAPDGATTSYTYDPATLRVATITDANGHITSYEYDAQGNRTKITDALGHVSTFTYEPTFNMMTSMTDPKGRVTTYEYDSHGNRIKETDPLLQTRRWTYDSHGNVLKEKDKRGFVTSYEYDAGGNRNMITAPPPLGYITRMTYDSVGNLKTRTDPNMHTTMFDYDGLNRLITQTDPVGTSDKFEYDGQGNRTKVIDRNAHVTAFKYDLRERLIKTTDALNKTTTAMYDLNNNRTSITDKNSHTTTFVFDVQNRLSQMTDALGNTTDTTYDPAGNVLSQTDANGHVTAYQYDELNRRTLITDAEGYVTTLEYDMGGSGGCTTCGATPGSSLITTQTDGNLKVTYFKFDKLDRLIKVVRKEEDTADVIDASDAVTLFAYDPDNNLLTMTEPNANTTAYEYDVINRRTTETNAAGDVTRFTYDGANNLITTTAPNGNVTLNTYDALDRVIQIDDSIGRVGNHTYDNVGNRLSQTDGNGNTTTFNYDAINRLITVTDPLLEMTITKYDPVGNVVKVIDRNRNVTTHTYDDINRRISTTDALPATTQYEYDGVGNLKKITDANSHATRYDYDNINRLIKETYADPPPNMRTFGYDAVNLVSRTDQKGQTTTYAYNDLYFLLQRAYPVSPADNFTYDLSGRMLTAERGGWLVTSTYDGANRVTQSVQNGKTVGYSYDIPGRTRRITYPGGRTFVEQTDFRSRLSTIDDSASPPPIASYTYDLGNRVDTRTYRNGVMATYTYNANNWILSLEHTLGGARIAGFGYDYDKEGNKKFEQKRDNTSRSEAFAYDKIYRLIHYRVGTLVGSIVPVPLTQTTYNLDQLANWNSKTTDGVTETRTHNEANEITQIDGSLISHDDNGNLSQDQNYQYAYDEENRLVTATRLSDSRAVGRYAYDALGRRIRRIADPELVGAPVETLFFHDGARIIEEQNGSRATEATYVYGNYIDAVLTMDRAGQTFYYHANHLYSVSAITDAVAAVVERYRYDAYGTRTVLNAAGVTIPSTTIGNQRDFCGMYLDNETGNYHTQNRPYDPDLGRWNGRDPEGYVDGMSLYAAYFVPNSLDPTGTTKIGDPCLHKGDTTGEEVKYRYHKATSHLVSPKDYAKWIKGLGAFTPWVVAGVVETGYQIIYIYGQGHRTKLTVTYICCNDIYVMEKYKVEKEKSRWKYLGFIPAEAETVDSLLEANGKENFDGWAKE
jgi:RHS repeat-associated protein